MKGAIEEEPGAEASSPGSKKPYSAQKGRKKAPPAEKSRAFELLPHGRSGPTGGESWNSEP